LYVDMSHSDNKTGRLRIWVWSGPISWNVEIIDENALEMSNEQ